MTQPGKPKPNPPPGIKIRTNYVPKVKQLRGKQAAQICPRCNQPVPTSEMGEHMRIELLDPRWKEQKDKAREKNKESNLNNDTVSSNLKLLAKTRPDIFGGDEFNIDKTLKEAEKGKVIWDGHTASIGTVTQKLGQTVNWEEQAAELQREALEDEARRDAIGPKAPVPAGGTFTGGPSSLPPIPSMIPQNVPQQAYAYPQAPPPVNPYYGLASYANGYDPYAGQYAQYGQGQGYPGLDPYAGYPPSYAYQGSEAPPHVTGKRGASPDTSLSAKKTRV
ncbi:hypothetical protein PhCBS80983_g04337 [Powellomyces hirtus]|uniref:Splicing factor 3A subunit 1 conserved domain-containing protein n=1 Tax=Powellomyces hirtus TaxID=109895 RepID=A0A507E0K4_9FUNG|nr:hypothetical protein PhCBS80983_g04337 [Powellomyces hirtus]